VADGDSGDGSSADGSSSVGDGGGSISDGDVGGGGGSRDGDGSVFPSETTPSIDRAISDDTPVVDVVLAAGRSIGRGESEKQQQELRKFAHALHAEHWMETAADLRALIADADEWAALPVPAKLKLGIKQALARD
jgi:hypothetical protein